MKHELWVCYSEFDDDRDVYDRSRAAWHDIDTFDSYKECMTRFYEFQDGINKNGGHVFECWVKVLVPTLEI